jgi:hypothetical protein
VEQTRRLHVTAIAALVVAASLALAGCVAAVSPSPSKTAAAIPAPAPVDTGALIGLIVDPIDTTWSGTDSAGDLSVFALHKDHTVTVTYGTNTFDESGDTWAVRAGVLSLHIHIDAANGYLDYAGQYAPSTGTIAATGTTSVTAKTVTVTLSKQ